MRVSFKELWANKNFRYSAIIAVAMLLWLTSGLLRTEQSKTPGQGQSQAEEEMAHVRGRHIEAEPYPVRVSVKGKTQADRVVDVKAEVTGQVEAIVAEKGQRVAKGDVICRLAMEDREGRLEEAKASVEQARIDYQGAQRLQSGGFQSESAIASAKARLETAQAVLTRRQLDVEKTAIRAPFDGIVEEQTVEEGALMRPGDTCATILDLDPLVIAGQVAEDDVVKLAEGEPAQARLTTGEKLPGRIRYISRRADEQTRTFRLEVIVPNPDMRLFSGITTELFIPIREVPAHLIASSLLILDDQGDIGVRVLNGNHRVEFYNVNIIGDAQEGIWVTGLPEKTLLITVGQQYVGEGEKVTVTLEDMPREEAHAASTEL